MLIKLHKFFNLPFDVKLLFFEALFTQYTVWLILQFVPFRKMPKIFSNPRNPVSPDKNLPEQIRLVTGYANGLGLWKNRCLVQSLTARRMLSRRSIASRVTLGVMHNSQKKMLAHAWLTASDVEMVKKSGPYDELYTF